MGLRLKPKCLKVEEDEACRQSKLRYKRSPSCRVRDSGTGGDSHFFAHPPLSTYIYIYIATSSF